MDTLREWVTVIQQGGWSGLLMGGFAIVAAMAVFAFIGNRYFWIVVVLALAGFGLYRYAL